MGLFGRNKIGGFAFPKHIVAEYNNRPVERNDTEIVDRVAVCMIKMTDFEHVADMVRKRRSAYSNGEVTGDEFREIVHICARQTGWDQGEALAALVHLRGIRARPELPPLNAFQVTAEHFIQSQTVAFEKSGKVYLTDLEEGPTDDNHPAMRAAREPAHEVEYAEPRFQLAIVGLQRVAPHLTCAMEARMARGEPRNPMMTEAEEQASERRMFSWGGREN